MPTPFDAWEAYDPAWLVELARKQVPQESWLPDALTRCTRAKGAGSAYVYFVDSSQANRPGATWQFERSIVLTHPADGEVVLDILQGQRVGGAELWEKLL